MTKQKYTDEFLIETLKEFAQKLGRTPTYNAFEKDTTVPSASIYKKRFGSWNIALKLAGLEANEIRVFKREEIKEEVLKFYITNGRSPNYNELKYSNIHIKNFWSSWSSMLQYLGLPQNRNCSVVTEEEELLSFLEKLYKDLGRIPTGRDIQNAGVNRNLYTKKFGSYKKALIRAGIVGEEYFVSLEEKIPKSIEAIQTFYTENNKPPTAKEYEEIAKKNNLAHRKALEKILGKRFSEICMDYLGVVFVNMKLSQSDHIKSEPLHSFGSPVLGNSGCL